MRGPSAPFVDFDIGDGLSEGETDLDFRNDTLMRGPNDQLVRNDASRKRLGD